MTDLLIRDVPDDVVAAIDAAARRMGLSRSEYLRRSLAAGIPASRGKVTLADLERTAATFADLADEEVMRKTWE